MSKKNMNNYSVLMSVYKNDNPEDLEISIQSMLNQTIPCDQFIIVEDGPIPESLDGVVRKYENEKADVFTVIRLPENKGLGNALNQGIKHSRNELLARMDADDISYSNRCEQQLKKFAENTDLCILGAQINEFIGSPENIVSCRRVPCDYESIRKFARRRSPFNHPTVMYKKSVIEKLGGYPTLNRKEDLGLFIKAVNEGCFSENLDEVLLYYRTSEDNQKRRKTWVNCKEYIQVMWGFFKKGYCGITDMIYVVLGQLILFVTPVKISKILSNKLLRTRGKE